MKTPERATLGLIGLAIRIGVGQDQDGKLQKRLNRILKEWPHGIVAIDMKPWAKNPNPRLP
jgi:hypothetical protein